MSEVATEQPPVVKPQPTEQNGTEAGSKTDATKKPVKAAAAPPKAGTGRNRHALRRDTPVFTSNQPLINITSNGRLNSLLDEIEDDLDEEG